MNFQDYEQFDFSEISEAEVEKNILLTKKSTPKGDMLAWTFQGSIEVIVNVLTYLINYCLDKEVFLAKVKIADLSFFMKKVVAVIITTVHIYKTFWKDNTQENWRLSGPRILTLFVRF